MAYEIEYRPSALELWRLSVYGIYSSKMGLTNLFFSLAMVYLAFRFWAGSNIIFKTVFVLAISLFTIVQPLMIYLGARKQVKTVPRDMKLRFDDKGIHILSSREKSKIEWENVRGIIKKLDLYILYTTDQHGFIISNRLLRGKGQEIYDYVVAKMKESKQG